MRKTKQNNSLKVGIKVIFAFSVCVGLIIGLGILRFHAARLAYYLESVNQSIQKYSDEEVILRQELSALVAPIRIYSYCKESLGMQKVLKAETLPVRVKGDRTFTAARREEIKDWRSGFAWLFGRQ